MEQQNTEAIIFAILGLVALCLIMIFLFVVFQKKKNALLKKNIENQKKFEQEIAETQVEIREQTLRNISWELHDNIGQLLTLAKIQLQKVKENPDYISEINQNISNILNEVRSLSKIINPDYISNISLEDAISLEINRFNRLNYINAIFTVTGKSFTINPKSEIIIFRILQEFFSNTIKHSKASELQVALNYAKDEIRIFVKDNGKGFNIQNKNANGLGLDTMQKRAKLINTEIKITSSLNNGTTLNLLYQLK